jgi:hypothetical protein
MLDVCNRWFDTKHMPRPRCDPIDIAATLNALTSGRATPLRAYREYASTAARPYARSTWEGVVRDAERKTAQRRAAENEREAARHVELGSDHILTSVCYSALTGDPEPDDVSLDAASDAYWVERLRVKPSVLTTLHDNASLSVKGGAFVVCDGENRLVCEVAARKPQAIVMTGWGGRRHS